MCIQTEAININELPEKKDLLFASIKTLISSNTNTNFRIAKALYCGNLSYRDDSYYDSEEGLYTTCRQLIINVEIPLEYYNMFSMFTTTKTSDKSNIKQIKKILLEIFKHLLNPQDYSICVEVSPIFKNISLNDIPNNLSNEHLNNSANFPTYNGNKEDLLPFIIFDNLNFRSKAEVAVYKELKKRNDIAIFPLATSLSNGCRYEPDFLTLNKRTIAWAILNIHDSLECDKKIASFFDEAIPFKTYSSFEAFNNTREVIDDFINFMDEISSR